MALPLWILGAFFTIGGAIVTLGTPSPDIGLGLIAIGLGAVAIALSLQNDRRTTSILNEIKRGEIDQKLAMVYTYVEALWLPRKDKADRLAEAPYWDYLVERVILDVRTVIDIRGEISLSMREEIEAAERALTEQFTRRGLDATRIEGVFSALLFGMHQPLGLGGQPHRESRLERIALLFASVAFGISLFAIGLNNYTTWKFDAIILSGFLVGDYGRRRLFRAQNRKILVLGHELRLWVAYFAFVLIVLLVGEAAFAGQIGVKIIYGSILPPSVILLFSMLIAVVLLYDFMGYYRGEYH